MALRVRLSARAVRDLQEIRDYLMARSPSGADRVRRDIERTITTLGDNPGIGRATHIANVRVLNTGRYPYLVYHRVDDRELVIVHVRHGARAAPTPKDM